MSRKRASRPEHTTFYAVVVPLLVLLGLAALAIPTAARPDAVAVSIKDDGIDMPDSLTAGATTFEVTNRGSQKHSLAIAKIGGGAADAHLDAELGPGETATLGYDLKAGQYTVYCPLDQHRATLTHRLTVVPEKVPTP